MEPQRRLERSALLHWQVPGETGAAVRVDRKRHRRSRERRVGWHGAWTIEEVDRVELPLRVTDSASVRALNLVIHRETLNAR